jgi:signal transduction histidine kinase
VQTEINKERIRSEADKLMSLVNDLLSNVRRQRRHLQPKPEDIDYLNRKFSEVKVLLQNKIQLMPEIGGESRKGIWTLIAKNNLSLIISGFKSIKGGYHINGDQFLQFREVQDLL